MNDFGVPFTPVNNAAVWQARAEAAEAEVDRLRGGSELGWSSFYAAKARAEAAEADRDAIRALLDAQAAAHAAEVTSDCQCLHCEKRPEWLEPNSHSREKCLRCGWVMGSPPLNCQNDDTPHRFASTAAEVEALRAEIERLRKPDLRVMYGYELGVEEASADRDALRAVADAHARLSGYIVTKPGVLGTDLGTTDAVIAYIEAAEADRDAYRARIDAVRAFIDRYPTHVPPGIRAALDGA